HRQQIARSRLGHVAFERQEIARFAYRPCDIGNDARGIGARFTYWTDVMVRFVERGTNEIVHPGVDDDKGLSLDTLEIKHARDQDTGIADNQAARFEDKRALKVARRALDHRGVSLGMRRRLVVLAIGNAETAAEIDMADGVTVGAQGSHEIRQQRKSIVERLEFRDLA